MIDRRDFLRGLMSVTAGLTAGRLALDSTAQADDRSGGGVPPTRDRFGELLPMRRLGRTGEWVTALCFGGSHLVNAEQNDRERQALLETAMAEGVRFYDNARIYGNGEAERAMGQFLTPKYRGAIYLMTKTRARSADEAKRDMDDCRRRLNVDVIDLMQLHAVRDVADADARFDHGVVDVLLEAREQGKVRHLGFTGHDSPAAHLRVLERLAGLGLEFEACQMPMNVADPGYLSFIDGVLPVLVERGYAVLAMKTLVFGSIVGKNLGWKRRGEAIAPRLVPERMSLSEALGFVWSLPVASLVSGMDEVAMVKENAALLRKHQDLDEAGRRRLVDLAAEFAGPRLEFYKA
ncbi:MAG: aldo/keto reductase [Planctomycetota bacterium]